MCCQFLPTFYPSHEVQAFTIMTYCWFLSQMVSSALFYRNCKWLFNVFTENNGMLTPHVCHCRWPLITHMTCMYMRVLQKQLWFWCCFVIACNASVHEAQTVSCSRENRSQLTVDICLSVFYYLFVLMSLIVVCVCYFRVQIYGIYWTDYLEMPLTVYVNLLCAMYSRQLLVYNYC